MASKQIAGRMGMTKAKRKEARLAGMQEARKRQKAASRAVYHSQFKREPGKRGYPRLKGGAPELGFVKGK